MRPAVFLSLLLVLAGPAPAKSYWYPSIETEVALLPDGDARIRQMRTYYFDGSFSWAFVDLEKRGAENIIFNRLYEWTGREWRTLDALEVTDRATSVYVKWGYRAESEARAFLLDYTVVGAVKRYRDVAEFYWKVIEDEHEFVREAAVTIVLPGPSPDLFKVYVHSRAGPGELEFSEARDTALVRQEEIPRNAFQEVRVLASPDLFVSAPGIDAEAYARILGEEKRNFIMSALRVYLLLPLSVLLLLVLPLVLLLYHYFRYGREPAVDYEAIYEHEPPRNAPPLVIPAILHQKPDANVRSGEIFRGVFATLLDLAGKGYVTVEELGPHKGYRFNLKKPADPGELNESSRAVLDLLFGQVSSDHRSFTDREFREYGRQHASSVRRLLDGWFDDGRDWWRRELGTALLDRASTRAYGRFVLLVLLSVALGVIAGGVGISGVLSRDAGPLPWFGSGIAGFGACIVFLAIGRTIHRWTAAAHLEHLRWKRFRRFLREFSAIEEAPVKLLAIWEHYYVYAVVLGVAEEFLKNIGKLALARSETVATPVWFAGASFAAGSSGGMAGFQSAMKSLSGLSSNFTAMTASFSPKSSSGGGFSGGGGGGGGGGSSGAG